MCFFPQAYCYLEIKLYYLNNLRLFSIRVKELFKPTVLQKKKKKQVMGFALFKGISWDTNLWEMIGDFYGKNSKVWKGNLYLNEKSIKYKQSLVCDR